MLSAVAAIDPYSEALLSLKSELVDDDNTLHNWMVPSGGKLSGKSYACSWSGIKCNNDSTIVTSIDLSMKKLEGVLSGKQFSIFTNVTSLNLSYNIFSGQLPAEIFNLTGLTSLDISRNNFSGPFPGGIPRLQNLLVLDAFSNSFSGPLPAEFSQLANLKVLNLAGSYFKGSIPPEYGSFKSLEFLHLAGNSLTGSIPPELGNLKTVTHMEIGYNLYQGFIPPQLGNMSQLQYLDIAGANLSGPIPKQLSNLTSLQSLFLFRNQLTGSIPSELSNIESLTDLDLSVNFLSGSIPESFSELENLRLLSLMYNDMSGTVPKGIAQLPSLETLLIWNNRFSGSLPESLGRNSKLKWVDVSTNNFVGSIPPDICVSGVLFKLILFSNKFTGGLSSIYNFTKTVLPTGITVLVKKIEWEVRNVKVVSEFITRLGNARHKNLIRLLGFCHNQHLVYLLYDHLPNGNLAEKIEMKWDWAAKFRTVVGIARGLCFLHHECYPAIPHGDLKPINIVFDENMEPHLAEFGFKQVLRWSKDSSPTTTKWETELIHVYFWMTEYDEATKEELCLDIYKFGEMILEILTGGRLTNAGASIHSKPWDVLFREIYNENEASSLQEIKLVLEVAMLCTRSRSLDRPSMEDVLKLLSGLKHLDDGRTSKEGQ
uniref:Receptor protein kinase CLAVATA1 n=1 Tax=Cajanus cajan TaxID=3821 RepID=A0A151QT00_CAJCA|nr:Receptor protein kinase CLAVATA1 [Cajanus cajan]